MRIDAKLHFDDMIIYIGALEDGRLGVVDSSKQFTLVELSTQKHLKELRFKQAEAHREKKGVCFSPDGNYLAFNEKDQSVVRVIDIQKQALYHSFPTLNNPMETLRFDPSSHYLIAGSTTGRVFLWNLFSSGQVSRLSSFPEYMPHLFSQPKINYVSDACFSPSGKLVATTGYGGSIVVTNIHTEVSPKRITPNHVRINTLCFIGEQFLAAGNIEGGIDIIDLHTSQVDKHYPTTLGVLKHLCVSRSGTYLLASGNTQQISLFDLGEKKIIDPSYIQVSSKITAMTIDSEDVLYVGSEDGSICIFNLRPAVPSLNTDTTAYAQVYELLYSYPLLKDTPLQEELEERWERLLEKAIQQLEQRQPDEALKSLNVFSKVRMKQEIIKEFQTLITNFERFRVAVNHENFALAYTMADHMPLLHKTTPYREMEALWDDAFNKAQTYVITENTHQLFKVLEPFGRVTSKLCFIQVLLHQPKLFLEFVHLINTRHYEKIFTIAGHYPCLQEIESYQNVIHAADDLQQDAYQSILTREYDLADRALKELAHIPYMKARSKELFDLCSLLQKVEAFYRQGDLKSAYTFIDKHPELQEFPLIQEIEEQWKTKMRTAEEEALQGHTKEIKAILAELLTLSTRAQKIGMLLRQSFLIQLKLLVVHHKTDKLQKAIENYIALFSYDTELHNLITKLKNEDIINITLTPEQEYRRPRSLWLSISKGKIPDTIL
jgi:WD domain, G-beta repeat